MYRPRPHLRFPKVKHRAAAADVFDVSEPAPASDPAPGWYADPWRPDALRWWDGAQWTSNQAAAQPHPAEPASAQPAQPLAIGSLTKHQIRRLEGGELFTRSTSKLHQRSGRRRDLVASMSVLERLGIVVLFVVGAILVAGPGIGVRIAPTGGFSLHMDIKLFVAGLLAMFVPYRVVCELRRRDMRNRWMLERGLQVDRDGLLDLDGRVPVCSMGTRRNYSGVIGGELGGHHAWLGIVGFDNHVRLDADKRQPSARVNVDGEGHTRMVVRFRLPESVAARYPGISVMARGGDWSIERGSSEVELESIAFHGARRVMAAPGQDPVAVRELFGPQLIDELLDRPVSWDQRGADLVVVFDDDVDLDESLRDDACAAALLVYEHYLSEAR